MAQNETAETQSDSDFGYEMTGNLVTDERLSEVQRNQLNTSEKRLERLETKVFGSQDDQESDAEEVEDSEDDDTKLSAKEKRSLQTSKLSTPAKK